MPRYLVLSLFLGFAVFLIAFFSVLLPQDSKLAVFLLDYSKFSQFPYPLTIQNLMYVVFFIALGECFVRYHCSIKELSLVKQHFLPEDENTVLRVKDLGAIRQKVMGKFDGDNGFLPYLINLSILQFQASRSVDQTVNVLNSSLELINHRVDLRYSLMRYIVWVIPTIGFIGTVVGIASALGYINPDHIDLKLVTGSLAVAFNTTVIALVQSAILVFIQQFVQKKEELSVNQAGDYCLKNLINRLFVEQSPT
jgi:biopolymer transport protein ExbB/TolQ